MLDKYYINTGDSTTYRFATGHKPTLACIIARTARLQYKFHSELTTEAILETAYNIVGSCKECLK